MPSWRALRRAYVGAAVLWLNACLLFVAANLVAAVYASLRAGSTPPRGTEGARPRAPEAAHARPTAAGREVPFFFVTVKEGRAEAAHHGAVAAADDRGVTGTEREDA
jgi:hypothetical protein